LLQYYFYLKNEKHIAIATVDAVHCLLHATFQLAVRDDIIRKNPTDGVMKEFTKKSNGRKRGTRHALTVEQETALMNYVAKHPVYYRWWPLLTILLGTGCRIGEALGLRWQDLDFEKKLISINHAIVYYPEKETKGAVLRVSLPKTEAGIRTIPMLDIVKDAFDILREEQEETGGNTQVIDGMSGFVFCNRFGMVPNPQTVNKQIQRIRNSYNAEEEVRAKREKRDPVILPQFSCHHLRHTFATRLCETESNLKVIQSVMGHSSITTTMDIYADATERKTQEAFDNLALSLNNIF
jgi:integrase